MTSSCVFVDITHIVQGYFSGLLGHCTVVNETEAALKDMGKLNTRKDLVQNITNYRKAVIIHRSIHLWLPRGGRSREPSGLTLSPQRCKRRKLGLWDNLSCEHAVKCECGYLFCSRHHRIRASVQPDGSHMTYQRNYRYIVSLVACPRINPYVDILIWTYP